jgi:hypothetical protein
MIIALANRRSLLRIACPAFAVQANKRVDSLCAGGFAASVERYPYLYRRATFIGANIELSAHAFDPFAHSHHAHSSKLRTGMKSF